MVGPVTIGIDIGQKRDSTAIAVAEREMRGGDEYHLIRRLERLPLRTPYHEIARRLEAIVAGVEARVQQAEMARQLEPRWLRGEAPRADLTVFVDATGVGKPVVDALEQAGVPVTAVYFTYGDRRTKQADGSISLGKALLVSRLQALLQTGRILLPKTTEAGALAEELQDYEIRVDQDANDKYGAFKVGTHDDLVTALGLAVQAGPGTIERLDNELATALQDFGRHW
ncbi:MAG: hypothetical protein NVSMB65_18410 [Chloroflexota bacterium]